MKPKSQRSIRIIGLFFLVVSSYAYSQGFYSNDQSCGQKSSTDISNFVGGLDQLLSGDLFNDKCHLLLDKSEFQIGSTKTFEQYQVNASLISTRLSPFWAQSEIGSPEATYFLDQWDLAHPKNPSSKVMVGIVDDFLNIMAPFPKRKVSPAFQKCMEEKNCPNLIHSDVSGYSPNLQSRNVHGIEVGSLIIGAPPLGVGSRATLDIVSIKGERFYENRTPGEKDYAPRIVNLSLGWEGETLSILNDRFGDQSILVNSAGNNFPKPMPESQTQSKMILVGCTEPDGDICGFSQESEKVAIAAPAGDLQILTEDAYRTFFGIDTITPTHFGRTSAAAPLVTAALSNVLSLLPDLNREEALQLLKKTAIKTGAFYNEPAFNGAGVVNAYKLVRIAAKLKAGWPANRGKIIASSILYDFKTEARRLYTQAKSLLYSPSCSAKREGFKKLRLSFFLDSSSLEPRELLASIYFDRGYYFEGLYYRSPIESHKQLSDRIQNRRKHAASVQ